MKRRRYYKTLTIPAIKKLRESIEKGDIGRWLINAAEEMGAGSMVVRYTLKRRPWIVTIEAKRSTKYDNT